VKDFPAGAGRYVVGAEGYVATVVNGAVVFDAGTYTGALPGHVLRG
jgi:N-acyl-D-aspartate/D-glutamate deacylase